MHAVIHLAREASHPEQHAVIATDAQGTIVFWDEGAKRLYGWSEPEVLGRPITEVTPSELSRAQADEIMAALAAGNAWSGEFTVRTRSGHRFEAAVANIPVRGDDGAVIGVVGVSRRLQRVTPEARISMAMG